LTFAGVVLAADPDDGSWITRRTPFLNRLDLSAQEVLGLASRKLTSDVTSYRALEVVASPGNFQVQLGTDTCIAVTLSTGVTVNVTPGTTVYIANPYVAPSTFTVQYAVTISTWHEFVVTSATSATLYPTSFMTYLAVFSVVSDGGGGTLNTNFGSGMRLLDGVGKVSPRFDVQISSPVITMSGLSIAATYYVDVFGGY
jgi:hypothetical protein